MHALLGVLAAGSLVPAFGAEQVLAPWDAPGWHHTELTREACRAAGFSPLAAERVAFHATAVDHYLVNPLWRLRTPRRLRASRAIEADLTTLHFDDLVEAAAVRTAARHYLSGTAAALLWAAHAPLAPTAAAVWSDPIEARAACVRQVVGLSLHALQDLASHSTWIDHPRRRHRTPWAWDGDLADLCTGAVETDGELRHGEMGLRARGRVATSIPLRGRWRTPSWSTGLGPGINVDSRWQAPLGVATRGGNLAPGPSGALSSDEAFALARALAGATSAAWLAQVGAMLDRLGDLGERVRGYDDPRPDGDRPLARRDVAETAVFEDPALRPHVFLAAQAGLGALAASTPDQWHVRLDVSSPTPSGRAARHRSRVVGPFDAPPSRIGVPRDGSRLAVAAFRRGDGGAEVVGFEPVEGVNGVKRAAALRPAWSGSMPVALPFAGG